MKENLLKLLGLHIKDPFIRVLKLATMVAIIFEIVSLASAELRASYNLAIANEVLPKEPWEVYGRYAIIATLEIILNSLFITQFYLALGNYIHNRMYPIYAGEKLLKNKDLDKMFSLRETQKYLPKLGMVLLTSSAFFALSFLGTTIVFMTYLSGSSETPLMVGGIWSVFGYTLTQMTGLTAKAISMATTAEAHIVASIYSSVIIGIVVVIHTIAKWMRFRSNPRKYDQEEYFQEMFELVLVGVRSKKALEKIITNPDEEIVPKELAGISTTASGGSGGGGGTDTNQTSNTQSGGANSAPNSQSSGDTTSSRRRTSRRSRGNNKSGQGGSGRRGGGTSSSNSQAGGLAGFGAGN